MINDPRVDQMLEELLESGGNPEEACRTCPDLLPQVKSGLQRLRRLEQEFVVLFPPADTSRTEIEKTQPPAELPQIRGYDVLGVLGRGGMGVVYKARHLRLDRPVALKMLLIGPYAGPDELERFLREAQVVAALRHPNVVHLYDVGDVDGRPYFTMELIDGGSLAVKLGEAPLAARLAASLVATVAEAVEAAHQSGIIHRDLKPANVLLTLDGHPKVTDFGLARRLEPDSALTLSGAPMGTPSYMAPEQARGDRRAIGPATDVYALGAILYECLTGRPPFRAATAVATLQQVGSDNPVPPSHLNASVPRDLETICLKCLHKEPRLRYVSAAALAADLHHFLRGEAITARPERWPGRLLRRVRRRPAFSAAVAVAAVVLVGLAGGGLWLLFDRAAAAWEVKAERAATDRAAEQDLREMVARLQTSSWPEARSALERARGRLGDRESTDLRRLLNQGDRNLVLAARLEEIRLTAVQFIVFGFVSASPDEQYKDAFRGAGLGQTDEDPEVVAARIRTSDIRNALVAALDNWSSCNQENPERNKWILEVARRADPDPTGWRDRARDPNLRADQAALAELIRTASVADQSTSLLLRLYNRLRFDSKERLPFLKRIQKAHPADFWANIALAEHLATGEQNPAEAIRYYQASLSIRPRTAYCYFRLGMALSSAGRLEEAAEHFREAVDIEPTYVVSQAHLANALMNLGRDDEAIVQLQAAIRSNSNNPFLRAMLGNRFKAQNRFAEAITLYRQALALDPQSLGALSGLRTTLHQMGRGEEARVVWQKALEANPPGFSDWYGYAEFCLFLGQEEEYRRARQALLSRFGSTTNPHTAASVAWACLLLPAAGEELRQAAALAGRGVAVEQSQYQDSYPRFRMVQGLAEYRQGRLDQAISMLRPDAAGKDAPAARLVLAMALHRNGKSAEARKSLADAVLAHDRTANAATDPEEWSSQILRRQAAAMILPHLPAFLDGKYQPEDKNERLMLLGVCQLTTRPLALARLYADAFAADTSLMEDRTAGHRYRAACAASLAGCARGEDAAGVEEPERARWRQQARQWLRADLAAWGKALDSPEARNRARQALTDWRHDPDLAGLHEPDALNKLRAEERDEWLALWRDVDALLRRTVRP
jgi:eukaryotic-like serine/threonine-protein kinase